MKRVLVLLVFCLAFTGLAFAEEKPEQTLPSMTSSFLLPMPDVNGKWGYINSEGKYAIAPQFDFASEFRGNYARVIADQEDDNNDDGYHEGIIDRNGCFVLEPFYCIDEGYDGGYYGGKDTGIWLVLRKDEVNDESMGFFDIPSGHFSGFHWSDVCQWCSESHLIPVMDDEYRVGYAERSSGEMVIPCQYDTVVDPSNFYGGVAAVCLIPGDEDEDIILIDETGTKIPLPEGIHAVLFEGAFDDRILVVNDEGLYGFADPQGNIAIEPQFIYASRFYNGRAAVEFSTEDYGFIDTAGSVTERGLKSEPTWEYSDSDGITYEVDNEEDSNIVIIKKYGDEDKEKPEAYGFYDIQSGFLQMPVYEEISEFTGVNEPLIAVCVDQHWGFCKRDSGELVIPCIYDWVDDYVNGFAIGSIGEQDEMCEQDKIFFGDHCELFDREGKVVSFPDGMNPIDLLDTDDISLDREGAIVSFPDGKHSLDLFDVDTLVLIMQRNSTDYLFGLGSTDGRILLEPYTPFVDAIYIELGVEGEAPGG